MFLYFTNVGRYRQMIENELEFDRLAETGGIGFIKGKLGSSFNMLFIYLLQILKKETKFTTYVKVFQHFYKIILN